MICCTGHRPQKLGGFNLGNPMIVWVREITRQVIIDLYQNEGEREFEEGGALGFDTEVGEIVIDLRDNHGFSDMKLILVRPYETQGMDGVWPAVAEYRYKKVMDKADEVIVVTPGGFTQEALKLRNKFMVDKLGVTGVLACWDGSHSGTADCVDYALMRRKRIVRINPHLRSVNMLWKP